MKDDKPTISVAVITYNQEKTIAQALDSILCQKGNFNMEVVIGEDAGTDGTLAICKGYEKRHPGIVKVLSSESNLGIMGNFARTVKACTGDYVAILAGDDYWCDEQKLQKQLHYMQTHPEYGVVCTDGYRLMVKSGRLIDGIAPLNPVLDGNISKFYKSHINGIYAQPLSLLIRRDLLAFVDFDEFVKRKFPMEDYPMQCILAHHTLFGHLPDKTCVYRVYHQSATFASYDRHQYLVVHRGIVDIRRYLHSLFPNDVPFTEKWAVEYLEHKKFLQKVWFGRFKEAKAIAEASDPASPQGKKFRRIVASRLGFYSFMLYKHLSYRHDLKSRTV